MTRQNKLLDVTTSDAARQSPAAADRPRGTEAVEPPSTWAASPRQAQQHNRLVQMQSAARSPDSLPHGLRQGIESLSGVDMSAVRVHRNSSRPASLQAHAFAHAHDGPPHSAMNAVTIPNMPASDSTCGRMWQCQTHAPGLSMCTSTE